MPEGYEGIGNDGATRCRASLHASMLVRWHSPGGPVLVLESRSSMAATCWRLTWDDMSHQGFLFHVKRSGYLRNGRRCVSYDLTSALISPRRDLCRVKASGQRVLRKVRLSSPLALHSATQIPAVTGAHAVRSCNGSAVRVDLAPILTCRGSGTACFCSTGLRNGFMCTFPGIGQDARIAYDMGMGDRRTFLLLPDTRSC